LASTVVEITENNLKILRQGEVIPIPIFK
jgi:DNA-binding Xre family transcriptional regulator